MRSSRFARRLTCAVLAVPCAAAVVVWGELSLGALLAVATAGAIVVGLGLVGRSGEAAPPVGRRGVPWLGWLTAAVAWELVTRADARVPTVSDLADPLLADPLLRGAATLAWLAAGIWLLDRPTHGRQT